MNARLLRYTIYTAILPVSGVLLILNLKSADTLTALICILATFAQVPVILFCKRDLKQFIRPDVKVLLKMDVPYVPAPYEPGRFKTDARIASGAVWLTLLAPLTAWFAIQFPEAVKISVLNDATYFAPAMFFIVPMLFCLFFGILALPFWFETARANEIFSEINEQKRYLLMGFAEYTVQEYYAVEYIETRHNRKFA